MRIPEAFNQVMAAMGLPKATAEEKALRDQSIQEATKYAIEVPFKVMQIAFDSMQVIKAMAAIGNPNSVSDAGVGALCSRAAVVGAFLNVRINASSYNDKEYVREVLKKGDEIQANANKLETEILEIVNKKISAPV